MMGLEDRYRECCYYDLSACLKTRVMLVRQALCEKAEKSVCELARRGWTSESWSGLGLRMQAGWDMTTSDCDFCDCCCCFGLILCLSFFERKSGVADRGL